MGPSGFPLALHLSRITDPKGNDRSAVGVCFEISVPAHGNSREKVPRLPKTSTTGVDPTEVNTNGVGKKATRKTCFHLANLDISHSLAIRFSDLSICVV